MKLELKCDILNDDYTGYIYQTFDIQSNENTTTEVEYSFKNVKGKDWNIGVIYGSSGSGKSTILKKMGGIKEPKFDNEKPLISNFNWITPKEASFLLTSIGLSSVPTWLRPFHTLSNGEQYRAKLAYLVGKAKEGEVILVDEYTSVVDRDVAKAMSNALQKYIRRTNKRIILASCHFDIMEWLQPDWIQSPQKNNGEAEWVKGRLSKPRIELQVSRVEVDTWDIFKKHHYLTENVNKSCKFFLFEWNNKPIGIVALLNAPRKGMSNGYSISRVVVLPDYQGLGFGVEICEFVASICVNEGGRPFIKTINPALGEYFNRSEDKWRGTSMNGKAKKEESFDKSRYKNRLTRLSYSHEYVGEPLSGYEELMLPIKEMREGYNKRRKTRFGTIVEM